MSFEKPTDGASKWASRMLTSIRAVLSSFPACRLNRSGDLIPRRLINMS
jgi:hypothetical protein